MPTLKQYLRTHYSESTAKIYYLEIQRYLQQSTNPTHATYQDVIQYIGKLRKHYSNSGTLCRILCSIKVYYSFLNESGQRKDHPAATIRLRDRINKDIQLQELFSREELESLLHDSERYSLLVNRNQLITSLLIYQALLPGELAKLKVQDINLVLGKMYVSGSDKTNARSLQLKASQISLLYEYLQDRKKLIKRKKRSVLLVSSKGYPFTADDLVKHVIRKFKGKYGERKVSITTIRQSVIQNLLKEGNDLRIVQVFAGHKKASSTEKYKSKQVDQLKKAIEKFHPMR